MPTANTAPTAAFTLAVKLARSAAPATADAALTPEQTVATDKLAAHVAKHNLSLADIIAAAMQADPVKRVAKAKPEAPKAEKPKPTAKAAKPTKPSASDAKRSADYAERVAIINGLRANVAKLYNGPSLAVRSNPKRINATVYAELIAAPKHRTTLDRISTRDVSALALIIQRGDTGGAFDPVTLNIDSGIFSRLASVAFIERAPANAKQPYRLTKRAIEHVNLATKRAA